MSSCNGLEYKRTPSINENSEDSHLVIVQRGFARNSFSTPVLMPIPTLMKAHFVLPGHLIVCQSDTWAQRCLLRAGRVCFITTCAPYGLHRDVEDQPLMASCKPRGFTITAPYLSTAVRVPISSRSRKACLRSWLLSRDLLGHVDLTPRVTIATPLELTRSKHPACLIASKE